MGGGDGIHSSVFLNLHPKAKLSILDLPGAFEGCKRYLKGYLATGTVQLIPADARQPNVSDPYDVVIMNELLEMFSRSDKLTILKQARKITDRIIITKFSLNANGTTPGGSALFSLRMFVKYPGSYLAPDKEIGTLLAEAGYSDVRIQVLSNNKSIITAGFSEEQHHANQENAKSELSFPIDTDLQKAWRAYVPTAAGFRFSCALLASLQLRILDSITPFGGSTVEEIVEEAPLPVLPLTLLLNILTAGGLIKKKKNRYYFDHFLRPFLTDTEHSLKAELAIYRLENQSWLAMSEKLSGKIAKTISFEKDMALTGTTTGYIRGVEIANTVFIKTHLETISPLLMEARDIMDIGGGHGRYAKLICEAYPKTQLSILDLPSVLEVAYRNNQQLVDNNRLKLIPGDATQFILPEAFDLILLNDILHYFSHQAVTAIFKNIYQSLRKDGKLVISFFDISNGNPQNHIFSLKAHLKSQEGQVYPIKKLKIFLKAAGLHPEMIYPKEHKAILICGKSD